MIYNEQSTAEVLHDDDDDVIDGDILVAATGEHDDVSHTDNAAPADIALWTQEQQNRLVTAVSILSDGKQDNGS
jgi:hypothetical protein